MQAGLQFQDFCTVISQRMSVLSSDAGLQFPSLPEIFGSKPNSCWLLRGTGATLAHWGAPSSQPGCFLQGSHSGRMEPEALRPLCPVLQCPGRPGEDAGTLCVCFGYCVLPHDSRGLMPWLPARAAGGIKAVSFGAAFVEPVWGLVLSLSPWVSALLLGAAQCSDPRGRERGRCSDCARRAQFQRQKVWKEQLCTAGSTQLWLLWNQILGN